MLNKCQHCNKEFESKRNDAHYCSDVCRQSVKRGVKYEEPVTDKTIPLIVTDSVTDKPVTGKFVNHITGEEHEITEISKTGLNYDLEEKNKQLQLNKKRCPRCGEPTWFGCAQCGKE